MQALDPSGHYADAAVIDALTGRYGSRVVDYRYDRLNSSNDYIEPLVGVVRAGSVDYNVFADIKRTARFRILDRTAVNYLRDRIRPWARLRMPDGGWVEWSLGVFVLSSPARDLDLYGTVTRDVEAFDQLVLLRDDFVTARYSVAAGVVYTAAISSLIATITGMTAAITASTLVLPAVLEWEPGTSKLRILNDLLGAINYESAFFDESGKLICRPYQSPASRPIEYLYDDDQASVRTDVARQGIDLFNVPNRITVIKSEPDQAVLSATVDNVNPASPTSQPARGRIIPRVVREADAADLTTLTAKANRLMFEASQVYESLDFTTAAMPMHSNADVLGLAIPDLAVDAKYSETAWSLDLTVGARMAHTVRRVVAV